MKSNGLQVEKHALQIYTYDIVNYISLITTSFLSYIPFTKCVMRTKTSNRSTLSCVRANTSLRKAWSKLKRVIDEFREHIRGQANITDNRLLLRQIEKWCEAPEKYVAGTISKCTLFRAAAPPQPSRNVSYSSLSKDVNDIVCVYPSYLESLRHFHEMDWALPSLLRQKV